jgi:hypothetical protein
MQRVFGVKLEPCVHSSPSSYRLLLLLLLLLLLQRCQRLNDNQPAVIMERQQCKAGATQRVMDVLWYTLWLRIAVHVKFGAGIHNKIAQFVSVKLQRFQEGTDWMRCRSPLRVCWNFSILLLVDIMVDVLHGCSHIAGPKYGAGEVSRMTQRS